MIFNQDSLSFKKSLVVFNQDSSSLKKKSCGIQNHSNFQGLFNKLDFVRFSTAILS